MKLGLNRSSFKAEVKEYAFDLHLDFWARS